MTEPLYRVCWRRYFLARQHTPLDIHEFEASESAAKPRDEL